MEENNPNAKLVAVICHFWFIGWIAALVINSNNRSYMGSFYLRQTLGIWLMSLCTLIIPIAPIVGFVTLAATIFSLISAIMGSTTALPLIGKYFQDWFKGL